MIAGLRTCAILWAALRRGTLAVSPAATFETDGAPGGCGGRGRRRHAWHVRVQLELQDQLVVGLDSAPDFVRRVPSADGVAQERVVAKTLLAFPHRLLRIDDRGELVPREVPLWKRLIDDQDRQGRFTVRVQPLDALVVGDAHVHHPPVTESEILGPTEAMRKMMEYFAHGPNSRQVLERLADAGKS